IAALASPTVRFSRHLFDFVWVLSISMACLTKSSAQQQFDPRVLAVEVSASVQSSPPAIVLHWPGDALATTYEISRKLRGEQTWTPIATLPGEATTHTDGAVTDGIAYEYQIIKRTKFVAPPYTGSG